MRKVLKVRMSESRAVLGRAPSSPGAVAFAPVMFTPPVMLKLPPEVSPSTPPYDSTRGCFSKICKKPHSSS